MGAKHKICFVDESANEYHHKMTFGSLRNRVLQKLLLVDSLLYRHKSWLRKELIERYVDDKYAARYCILLFTILIRYSALLS